jgi:hypothetical protein
MIEKIGYQAALLPVAKGRRPEKADEAPRLTPARTVVQKDLCVSRRIDEGRSCLRASEIAFQCIEASLPRQTMQSAATGRPIIHQKVSGLQDRRYRARLAIMYSFNRHRWKINVRHARLTPPG